MSDNPARLATLTQLLHHHPDVHGPPSRPEPDLLHADQVSYPTIGVVCVWLDATRHCSTNGTASDNDNNPGAKVRMSNDKP